MFDQHLKLHAYYESKGNPAGVNRSRISLKTMSVYIVLTRKQKTSVKNSLEKVQISGKKNLLAGKGRWNIIQSGKESYAMTFRSGIHQYQSYWLRSSRKLK